ncbi:MAG: hypothetical protein R2795_19345 [Saprospiraceae bacterium]
MNIRSVWWTSSCTPLLLPNGFDTSQFLTCVNIQLSTSVSYLLPPCSLADAPIELGANPNIPGNMIFTINGVISTTIDPIELT